MYLCIYLYALHTGTSHVVWKNLEKGYHTVTVKAHCIGERRIISNEVMKVEFQID